MIRGVRVPGQNYGGFGIKKRSWFGGGRSRVRPAFMEPLLQGSNIMVRGGGGGSYVDVDCKITADDAHDWRMKKDAIIMSGGGGGGRMRHSSSSSSPPSSFPLKDDAGYIGYITDDESGSGDEEGRHVINIMRRRRHELLRTDADISFSGCLFMMITAVGLLFLFLFAVSPWGVPPPRRL
jgi:hypothetical protein